jgi:phosphohistidine phosphatase
VSEICKFPVGYYTIIDKLQQRFSMDFFLVRHGEAEPEHRDRRRPLTPDGRREVEKIARAAAARRLKIAEILHSEKLRAKETAEILARFLSPARGVRESSGLSPEDDPLSAKADLEAAEESLMLVGHLPHVGRLAALLLVGDSEKTIVDFAPATMVCLARAQGAWRLGWTLIPEKA